MKSKHTNWNTVCSSCEEAKTKRSNEVAEDLDGLMDAEVIYVNTYPNPNNGNFEVEIINISEGKYDVKVLDLMGRVVYATGTQNFSGPTNIEISLDATMATGHYFVQTIINGKMYNTKIIVQQK